MRNRGMRNRIPSRSSIVELQCNKWRPCLASSARFDEEPATPREPLWLDHNWRQVAAPENVLPIYDRREGEGRMRQREEEV
jgi:hypothetical protein